MWMALKKLGYETYHFKEVGLPQNVRDKHILCWREALVAKNFDSGKPYGKAEFDKVLGRYQVRNPHCLRSLHFHLTSSAINHRQ